MDVSQLLGSGRAMKLSVGIRVDLEEICEIFFNNNNKTIRWKKINFQLLLTQWEYVLFHIFEICLKTQPRQCRVRAGSGAQ